MKYMSIAFRFSITFYILIFKCNDKNDSKLN